MPWHLPVNCDPPIAPLMVSGVESIHEGKMHILEEIGIEFLNPEACAFLQAVDQALYHSKRRGKGRFTFCS